MSLTFYDKNGTPVAYTNDGTHLFSFDGEPLAYFSGNNVYSFSGQHLGWFLDGWLRDHIGDAALFSQEAKGGPLKPLKELKPLKGIKAIKPIKGVKAIPPIKPIRGLNWSKLSGLEFFEP